VLAFSWRVRKTAGVLGWPRPDRELLDAAGLCGHLVGAGSVQAFLAEHRRRLFPDEMFADLFPSGRGRRSPTNRFSPSAAGRVRQDQAA
jgi:hypothetical protein